MRVQLLASLVAAVFSSVASCAPAELQKLNYGAFTQTATYSVANQLGFFKAYGLNVTYLQVPNSTYGYTQLLNGGYDILTGTIDNAVNLRFNSNNSITVIGQLDQGPELTIASIPSITDITQFQGKSLMVDSPVSGYAYILRKVLSLYGLYLENNDYSFQVVGGTPFRYANLIAGRLANGTSVYGSILTYPFSSEASAVPAAQRPNILAKVSDFIQPFSSSAFTIRQSAQDSTTDRALIIKFMSAMYDANKYLASNSTKSQSCSVQAIASQLNVSSTVAASAYRSALNPLTGETSSPGGNFTINRQGLLNVIDVRSQFGGFASVPAHFNYAQAILPGAGKLIDYTLTDEAIATSLKYKPNGNCI